MHINIQRYDGQRVRETEIEPLGQCHRYLSYATKCHCYKNTNKEIAKKKPILNSNLQYSNQLPKDLSPKYEAT